MISLANYPNATLKHSPESAWCRVSYIGNNKMGAHCHFSFPLRVLPFMPVDGLCVKRIRPQLLEIHLYEQENEYNGALGSYRVM